MKFFLNRDTIFNNIDTTTTIKQNYKNIKINITDEDKLVEFKKDLKDFKNDSKWTHEYTYPLNNCNKSYRVGGKLLNYLITKILNYLNN